MKESSDKKKQIKKVPGKKIMPKPPKFNIMWLYAAIIVVILGFQFFMSGNNSKLITYQKFENEMLKPGDVEKVVAYKQEDLVVAEVYIKKDRLSKEKYKDVKSDDGFSFGGANPQYRFTDGTFESLQTRLTASQKDLPEDQKVSLSYESRSNPIS